MKKPILLTTAFVLAVVSACAGESAVFSHAGVVRFERSGVEFSPRLYDLGWGTLKSDGAWRISNSGDAEDFSFIGKDGKTVVKGVARAKLVEKRLVVTWEAEALQDFEGHGLVISGSLPCRLYAGGKVAFGERKAVDLPREKHPQAYLGGAETGSTVYTAADSARFVITSAPVGRVMIQDNRNWGADEFETRFTLAPARLEAGACYRLELAFSPDGGIDELVSGSYVVNPDAGWVPLEDTTAVKAGSPLDFSGMPWMDAPAGKHGRLVVRNGHFEFERLPGVPQRFYGVNVVFGANYMSGEEAEELAERLARMGYNTIRIHHHERELCDRKDGTTILPEKMAMLDNLLNACIRRGIYLTTDLYVSRAVGVNWRDMGIDRDGKLQALQEYKELVLFNEQAFQNYLAFSRQLLGHVNPKTGRRWADEPALALLALVNEGNPGNNGYAFLASLPEVRAAYKGKIPKSQYENTPENAAFSAYLADVEIAFAKKMRRFLREEIGTRALITDLSCWTNPVQMQLPRQEYDYVDDHFYVDHPQFLKRSWSLPSKCPNVNPVRNVRRRGMQTNFHHRDLGKPFTLTEFNYSGPGQFRGVGGMMLGAQAALQDYDGAWRFAWSHDHDGALQSKAMTYFDVAKDPLQRATERAVMTLFMRRDMKTLGHEYVIALPEEKLRDASVSRPHASLGDAWFGWYARLGTLVADRVPIGRAGDVYPAVYDHKADYYRSLVAGREPGDGQVFFRDDGGVFGVTTESTVGFFVEEGRVTSGPLAATVTGNPAAVWVSTLDGKAIAESKRLLLTHVTDVQDTGTVYADRTKQVLLKWGKLPHLMRVGRAEISLALGGAAQVFALAADGSRRGEIAAETRDGKLVFTADTARDPANATYLYEIVVR